MLKRNLIANYLGQGWTALMGLAFVPLYIKYLGIEAYGLIGLFAVLTAWLTLLDLGMRPTLSREMARFTGGAHTPDTIRDLLRSIEVIAAGIALLIAGGVWAASDWLASDWLKAEHLPVPVVAHAFAIMGLVTALRFVEGVYGSSLSGMQRLVTLNAVTSGLFTLRGVGAVAILAWVSPTIDAFFWWQALLSLLTLATLAALAYRALPAAAGRARFSLAALRPVWRFAGGMLGITLLALLLTQVDKVLLSKLLTLSDFGYYTLATVVASALFMLSGPVASAWSPRLAQLVAAGDQAGLIRTYHQGAQLSAVGLGSAALVLIFYAETFLQLWTHDPDLARQVAPLLRLLVLGNLLNGLMIMPYQAQLAHGWTGLAVRINSVAVLIIVPAILWATPRYGAIGAAGAWIALNTGYILIGIHLMHRRIMPSEKWRWYWQDVLLPLAAATAALVALRWFLPDPQGLLAQTLTLAAAALATLTASALAAGQVRRQVGTMIGRFFPFFASPRITT